MDQWHRIESSEINLYFYGQLIFNQSVKAIQWGKFSQKMALGQLLIHMQMNESGTLPHTIYEN